eukprot:765856-Hanusia_phi.AAC.3
MPQNKQLRKLVIPPHHHAPHLLHVCDVQAPVPDPHPAQLPQHPPDVAVGVAVAEHEHEEVVGPGDAVVPRVMPHCGPLPLLFRQVEPRVAPEQLQPPTGPHGVHIHLAHEQRITQNFHASFLIHWGFTSWRLALIEPVFIAPACIGPADPSEPAAAGGDCQPVVAQVSPHQHTAEEGVVGKQHPQVGEGHAVQSVQGRVREGDRVALLEDEHEEAVPAHHGEVVPVLKDPDRGPLVLHGPHPPPQLPRGPKVPHTHGEPKAQQRHRPGPSGRCPHVAGHGRHGPRSVTVASEAKVCHVRKVGHHLCVDVDGISLLDRSCQFPPGHNARGGGVSDRLQHDPLVQLLLEAPHHTIDQAALQGVPPGHIEACVILRCRHVVLHVLVQPVDSLVSLEHQPNSHVRLLFGLLSVLDVFGRAGEHRLQIPQPDPPAHIG